MVGRRNLSLSNQLDRSARNTAFKLLIPEIYKLLGSPGFEQMEYFADKVGITIGTLSRWINGESVPSQESIDKLEELIKSQGVR